MTFPVLIPVGPWRLHPHAVFEVPDFEVYLQFDSFERDALVAARRRPSVRMKAVERLNNHAISTTLVVTLRKGLND